MGKITRNTEENKTRGKKLKAYCSECGRENNHIVMQSVDCDGSELIGYHFGKYPETVDWSDNYQIIKCQGCDTITFRHVSWFSEAEQPIGPDEWCDGTSTCLYPKRSAKTRAIKDYYSVPHILRRIYRETIDCFNNDALTLCAAGLRAIIEGICADKKIINGLVQIIKKDGSTKFVRRNNLAGKIAGLGEKGILTQDNTTILHEHRFLGNEAVHELNQPSSEELILAIDIVEHTFDAMYEMPDKANRLRLIKAKRLVKKESKASEDEL